MAAPACVVNVGVGLAFTIVAVDDVADDALQLLELE